MGTSLTEWKSSGFHPVHAAVESLNSAGSVHFPVILAILATYVQGQTRTPGKGALEALVVLRFAVPGTVVALAIVPNFPERS